jgi:hypothetical protein
MANPSTLSPGTRILWWAPYQAPVPQLFSSAGPQTVPSPQAPSVAAIPQNIAGQAPPYPGMVGAGPFPGLVQSVGGGRTDFVGPTAVVHDARGQPFLVSLGVNTATWTSGGSLPGVAH